MICHCPHFTEGDLTSRQPCCHNPRGRGTSDHSCGRWDTSCGEHYSQHFLNMPSFWPDLPPPGLDEVPDCPGLWLTEGWGAPVLLTARVAAASWKCTLTTFIFIWSRMCPNLSQALCYLYWQFFCQRYIASFIDTRVGPLQTNGERIYLFLQSSKNNCSKIFNTHLFLPTWSWSSC